MTIQIQNLSKTYEGEVSFQALKDVSLQIKEGEFVSMVGPSGSGKTTLLNCIAGLDVPQKGRVIIDGMSIYDLTEDQRAVYRREYIGLIFQQYHLIPILTAEENIRIPLAFEKDKSKLKKAHELLKRVGLAGKERNIPGQLSGGESQRVAIARALINDPLIILADEPTGNLDFETGKQIMELLTSLNKEGHTIVMVTHDPDCAKYSNRSIKLEDGKIVEIKSNGGDKNE